MKIYFFGKSDIGRVRGTNEDYRSHVKISDNEHLFIIADGMGGHQAGEVASRLGTIVFARNYRKTRKEGWKIEKSMLYSLTMANSSILKRALSDPLKRGMGTTFTALVLSPRKANIIHVGDSRIYLIRNKKIKRITTDHTFVEKMFQEGKINAEEARDHPQKNILYMSLGARESYIPEIINNIEIKNGDIITMCSDGLNNMIEDEEIKKIALSYNPKKSVKELIRLANENGGTDNITIQIIQVGSPKKNRKQAPAKKTIKKKSLSMTMAFFSLFILLLLNLNKIDSKLTEKPIKRNLEFAGQFILESQSSGNQKSQNLLLVDSKAIHPSISSGDTLFFSQNILFLHLGEDIFLFSMGKQQFIKKIQLKDDEILIPSSRISFATRKRSSIQKNEILDKKNLSQINLFVFQKKKTKSLQYQVININDRDISVTIQSDPELNSIDHESRIVKFLNLNPPLIPIFINRQAFIFHDQNHFYVIENPIKEINKEIKFYKIGNFSYSDTGIVSAKVQNQKIKILFFEDKKKRIEIFEIPSTESKESRDIHFKFIEKPLNIEYINKDAIVIYFSYGYITLKPNNTFVQDYYLFNRERLLLQKVLINIEANDRILIDKQNRIFQLKL
jgi:serine/threonine protein phosphatase PrpC